MTYDKDQPKWLDDADAELESDPAAAFVPRVSPGKRTLTMGLPARRSASTTAVASARELASVPTARIQRKRSREASSYERALFGPFDDLALPSGTSVESAKSTALGSNDGRAAAPVQQTLNRSSEASGYEQALFGPFHDLAPVQRALDSSSGAPMPRAVQGALERSYGADLSHVRVHTGAAPADAAWSLQAKAFTHGHDIYMDAGTYAPESPEGFSLLAHEAAHTVQAGSGAVQAKLEVAWSDSAAEREADQAASAAIRGERFAIAAGSGAVSRIIHRTDQREGTAIPDAATQSAIHSELFPASVGGGGTAAPWDGATGQPNEAANRAALIAEMYAAMDAHLAAVMPGINAVVGRRRVPIAQLEGAGQAAKNDADAHFGQWATAAALTVPQETARSSYAISASGAGQNLFDAQDTGDRATVGMAINPADLASWIAETEPGCVTARNNHHLVPSRSPEERTFLRTHILTPWLAANDADLRLYDQHGFAMSNPETGQIVLPTSVPGGLSDTAPGGGVPSDAERGRKWRAWRTMVHEYIHQLEHPALHLWPGRNRAISEGFCELFTKEVLQPLLPTTAGADAGRRTLVEGGDFGAPTPAIIGGTYNPGSYAGYLARVEAIQSHLGGASVGARNAMKAVFFQGHLEYLGYDTAGNPLTAPAGPQDQINIPMGLLTFNQLATAINVPKPDLRAANPGVLEPLSGRIRAPGCREHRVVVSSDGSSTRAETRRVIATQHNVTEAGLAAANPGVDFSTLIGGEIIVIPAH